MNSKRRRRLLLLLAMMVGVGLSVSFVLFALNKNINLYFTPSQLVEQPHFPERHYRIGGLVKKHSLQRKKNTLTIRFTITDLVKSVDVEYTGVVPALFREGQGVVVEGQFRSDGIFIAQQVLAKHDEKYMPPGISQRLKST